MVLNYQILVFEKHFLCEISAYSSMVFEKYFICEGSGYFSMVFENDFLCEESIFSSSKNYIEILIRLIIFRKWFLTFWFHILNFLHLWYRQVNWFWDVFNMRLNLFYNPNTHLLYLFEFITLIRTFLSMKSIWVLI